MNTTPSSNTDTTQQARRTEAARWVPEGEWYPRQRVGSDHKYEFCGTVGRFMLVVSFDGYGPTAEFRDTRDEAEDYATYAGSNHGGSCDLFLDLDTGEWTAIRVTRTYSYVTVDPDDYGMEPDDEEEDE